MKEAARADYDAVKDAHAVGTVVYHLLEGWSWVDSLYFCTACVTTVGFGDLTPTSDAARLFTVVYIFAGIAVIGTFLDARSQGARHRGVEGQAGPQGDGRGRHGQLGRPRGRTSEGRSAPEVRRPPCEARPPSRTTRIG
jgi:hypothetical protein